MFVFDFVGLSSTENSGLGSSAHLRLATKSKNTDQSVVRVVELAFFVALYPPLSAHEQVTKVIKTLSTEGPKANLQKFSSYRTRCRSFVHSTSPYTDPSSLR
jgi:leucyl aminopeptidase